MAETVTFFSNYLEHVITRHPHVEMPIPGLMGGWQTTQPPKRYRFEPAVNEKGEMVGRLDVLVGQDVLEDHAGWLAAGQEQGIKRDAATALQAHKEFGSDFWLLGHEPGTMYPRPQDWRRDVRKASVALDVETLERMIREEEASHNRRELVAEAQDALALIGEMVQAQADAQAAAEAAEEAPAPKAKAKPKAPAGV